MAKGVRNQRWPVARIQAFVRDWNDGMESDALRDKYGVRNPGGAAAGFRQQGFELARRKPGRAF